MVYKMEFERIISKIRGKRMRGVTWCCPGCRSWEESPISRSMKIIKTEDANCFQHHTQMPNQITVQWIMCWQEGTEHYLPKSKSVTFTSLWKHKITGWVIMLTPYTPRCSLIYRTFMLLGMRTVMMSEIPRISYPIQAKLMRRKA